MNDKRRNANKIEYVDAHDSVLRTEWKAPTRPYSQNELTHLEDELHKQLKISDIRIDHPECGHAYYIKKNGVRYKKIVEEESGDVGNCSMCWKISKTPRQLREKMSEFIDLYEKDLDSTRKSYFSYLVKKIFYTWLYNEMYSR